APSRGTARVLRDPARERLRGESRVGPYEVGDRGMRRLVAHVDLDDPGGLTEGAAEPGRELVQARAENEHRVRILDERHRLVLPESAGDPEVEAGVGEDAASQCRRARDR